MRIRPSVLSPVLAILTVAALVGTGMVLARSDRGDAYATLLGSTLEVTQAVAANGATVAQPIVQNDPVVQAAPTETVGGQTNAAAPSPTPRFTPTAPEDAEDEVDAPDEHIVEPSEPDDQEDAGDD